MKKKIFKVVYVILIVALVFPFYQKTAAAAEGEIPLTMYPLEKSVSSDTIGPGDVVTVSLKIPGLMEQSIILRKKGDVMLVMDTSGSMSWGFDCTIPGCTDPPIKIDSAKTSLNFFVDETMGDFDHVGLVSYANTANLESMLSDMTDSGKQNLKNEIDALVPVGSTSIGSGVDLAVAELMNYVVPASTSRPGIPKYIILASDGMQNLPPSVYDDSAYYPGQILQKAIDNDIKIFTVGIGTDVDEPHLENISIATEGEYFFAGDEASLIDAYQQIFEKIIHYDMRVIEGVNTDIVEEIIDKNGDGKINFDDMVVTSCGNDPMDVSSATGWGNDNIIVEASFFALRKFHLKITGMNEEQALCLSFDVTIKSTAVGGVYSIDNLDPDTFNVCGEDIPSDVMYVIGYSGENSCAWSEFPLTEVTVADEYIDCGLRVKNVSSILSFACEPLGTLTSPLQFSKNGNTLGVILVDPTGDKASAVRVKTSSGIKALRVFP